MKRFFYTTLSIIGLLVTLFMMLVFAVGRDEIKKFPDAPRRVTLDEAVTMLQSKQVTPWVWLTDVEPDCERMAYGTRSSDGEDLTLFIAHDPARTHQVVIEALGRRACNQIRSDDLYGVLRPMKAGDHKSLHKRGLVFADAEAPQWSLCAHCGPSYSKNGMIVVVVMILLLGGMTVHFFRARNRD
jgi:hypothetical protein